MADQHFFDRDLSWLSFNARVLQEASFENTPLLDRIRFLSIYSSNLDEFYRVRVPALTALEKIKKGKDSDNTDPSPLLSEKVRAVVNEQLHQFGAILTGRILPDLHSHGIHFMYGSMKEDTIAQAPEAVKKAVTAYFLTELLAFLQPVHLHKKKDSFFPENDKIYFAAVAGTGEIYLLNIPSNEVPRLYKLDQDGITHVFFVDDILRYHMDIIFPGLAIQDVYSIKITRDAELDLEDEYAGDIAEKIEKKLSKRDAGLATRFLYQPGMTSKVLADLTDYLGLSGASIMEGGRYHNLHDLADFPIQDTRLSYQPWPAIMPDVDTRDLFCRILEQDLLINTPYDSYAPILQFFNEAAIDPFVEEIFVTMYRIAHASRIAHALISAARNGKKVTVFVELKARFDEANNLFWAKKMKQSGIKIIYSIPGLKVHAKIALVKKRAGERMIYFGLLATGNLNETTARFYTDHILLTGNHDLLREMELLFIFLSRRENPRNSATIAFKHLLVAQFNLQEKFTKLIDREIVAANNGRPARIIIKMNNLEETSMIRKLYEASAAGVQVDLIIRGICCCIPGIPGISDHIRIRRIVDRYLEHGRVFIFHNGGEEEIFMGSADWMNRNLYRRIEVCFPLHDTRLKTIIRALINFQLEDNESASPRSQEAIYSFLGNNHV